MQVDEETPITATTATTTSNGNTKPSSSAATNAAAGVDDSILMKGDAGAQARDYAEYFCSYAFLYHQKQMLTDHRRMYAYHEAIIKNSEAFKGKTVVDVGTGTGVLSVWSAQAGAGKVVAVEYTDMAKLARVVVEKNGVSNVVEVVQGSAEDLTQVAEKSVDIIVSEWMGYFLLRESMLDSLLRVREKYLKPDGHMFPSHATMLWALVDDEGERQMKEQEYHGAVSDWHTFTYETKQFYGLDMAGLTAQYEQEQKQYYILSSAWAELRGEQVIGTPVEIYKLDLKTCTFEDVKGVPPTNFSITIPPSRKKIIFNQDGTAQMEQQREGEEENNTHTDTHTHTPVRVSGFAGWFTTDFFGNEPGAPLPYPTTLSTAPEVGYTHWGQQVFHLMEPLTLYPGDKVEGSFAMTRQKDNPRLYDVEVSFYVVKNGVASEYVSHKYQMP